LFVSEVVIRECKDGDAAAAQRRMNAVSRIPSLSLTPQAADLATLLITQNIDLYDSIVNADVPGSEGDSIATRPASTK